MMLLQWNRERGSREEYSTVEKSTVVEESREGRNMLMMLLQWNREGESREEKKGQYERGEEGKRGGKRMVRE